jgi:hypothetical protein
VTERAGVRQRAWVKVMLWPDMGRSDFVPGQDA